MVLVVLLVAAGCAASAGSDGPVGVAAGSTVPPDAAPSASGTGDSAPSPCGSAASPPATYRHVVVVIMENRTWSGVGGVGFGDPAMPFLHALARSCTTFSDWTETDTHQNSLSQYIGMTSGVADPNTIADCSPSDRCRSTEDNLFRQVRLSGGSARTYVEGATRPCSASGNAAKHIPALYYFGTYTDASGTARNDHDFCQQEVLPLADLDVSNLPTFAMIVPDLCNDGHDCGNDKVDAFARTWVSKVLASTSYAAGDTAVMVLYDEDHPVPNLIVAPTATPGANSAAGAGHAAMLRTWEEVLGVPVLGTDQVAAAPSLRSAANF
jgi:hypothetical protein